MEKFTQGKWDYEYSDNGVGYNIFPYDSDDRHSTLAYVYKCSVDEGYANALLIAHAPEMYYSLKNIAFELEQGNGSNSEYLLQVIPQIRSLLAEINHEEYQSGSSCEIMRSMLCECVKFLKADSSREVQKLRENIMILLKATEEKGCG